jgi:hypothetical protein
VKGKANSAHPNAKGKPKRGVSRGSNEQVPEKALLEVIEVGRVDISNSLADYLVGEFMRVLKSRDEKPKNYELNIVLTT